MSNKKVVLVTGASSGMGEATVRLLVKEGHIVYGSARRVEKMTELKKLGAHILKMDVTNEEDCINGINQIIKEQGRIDVLFNNAGYGSYGSVEEVPIEEGKRQFEVNLFGLARITQLVLPYMRKQKSGLILNNSSIGGKIYTLLGAWYHATKHAVEGFSDCLRFEVEQFGIDVVVVEPGAINSEWVGIASDNIMKVSGKGPYKALTKMITEGVKNNHKSPSPDVIAKVVSKAMNAKKPKTRYLAGGSTYTVFLRWLLPDRVFDGILKSASK